MLLLALLSTHALLLGGAISEAELYFEALSAGALVLWGWSGWKRRRRPTVSLWLLGPLCLVFLIGAIAAWNAGFVFSGAHNGFRQIPNLQWLPSWVDGETGLASLRHWVLWAGLVCLMVDLCSEAFWRGVFRYTVVFGGTVQACIALGQVLAGAKSILGLGWGSGMAVFGTFLYAGSAGAYLNALLPAFVLTAREPGRWRALGAMGIFGVALGLLWNTSRISSAVGLFLLLLLALGHFLFSAEGRWPGHFHSVSGSRGSLRRGAWVRSRTALFASLVGIPALFVFQVPPLIEKWRLLPSQWHAGNPRLEAFRVACRMVLDTGLFGNGAGSFALMFPYYASETGQGAQGFWRHAHCDYLEWTCEWGWLGMALWLVLPLGAVYHLARKYRRCGSGTDRFETVCIGLGLLAVALHGILDFPMQNVSVQLVAAYWLACAWAQGNQPPVVGLNQGQEAAYPANVRRKGWPWKKRSRPNSRVGLA